MINENKLGGFAILFLLASVIYLSYKVYKYDNMYNAMLEESKEKTDEIIKATKRNDSMIIVLDNLENKIDSIILSKEEDYEKKRDSIGSLSDDSAVVWFEQYIKSWKPRFGKSFSE